MGKGRGGKIERTEAWRRRDGSEANLRCPGDREGKAKV
jgi:hypothetical protein